MFWIPKGILTINDPRGRYMGMQHVARNFLNNRNIDISFLGPAECPTAVVLTLTVYPSSKEDEEREVQECVKRRAADPSYRRSEEEIRQDYQKRRMIAMHMKADYFKNASPELFATLLSVASTTLKADQLLSRYGTYNVYYNNGKHSRCTKEEFYSDAADFTYIKPV